MNNIYKSKRFRLTGIADLIFHNPQLANRDSDYGKAIAEINKKVKKSDDDIAERHKLEFFGSFYLDSKYGLGLPTDNVFAMVCTGARIIKGFKNKVLANVLIEGDEKTGNANFLKVLFQGPQNPHELWEDKRYHFFSPVVINRSKIFTLRPKIPVLWEFEGIVRYMPEINFGDLETAFVEGGLRGALGDYRPRYGRCSVEFMEN